MNGFAGACLKIFLPTHSWVDKKTRGPERFFRAFPSDSFGIGGDPESKIPGSPQIPKESEGTAVPPISILFPIPGKEKSKIAQKIVCDFLSDHGFVFAPKGQRQIQDFSFPKIGRKGKKSRRSAPPGGFFFRAISGSEKNTRIGGDPVPRKFHEFSGDPPSPVENRLRFSTRDEGIGGDKRFLQFEVNPSFLQIDLWASRDDRGPGVDLQKRQVSPVQYFDITRKDGMS